VIDHIDHVGIAVESIEKARGFYEALGLSIDGVEEIPAEGVRVAMIQCGQSKIELLEATTADSPIAKFIERKGPGIHHLCLSTDKVHEDSEVLRRSGYQLLRDKPTKGAGGCWVQFVHPKSTGGILVELAQPDQLLNQPSQTGKAEEEV
jgi:methylmalonyl-CoA/ethylmalonyl-CoA epimerase